MAFIKKILNRIRGEQPLEKLIKRGLKVGKNLTRMSGVIIDPSHCWHIEIGNDVILAPNVHILAHDASTKIFLNYTKIANTTIGDKVFIGASSVILPGVIIGNNVIIGSGSIVSKDIPSNSVAFGNPAKVICSLEAYIAKQKSKMNSENCFDEDFTLRNPNFNESHVIKMKEASSIYGQSYVK
jgi:maltose O-acetyltransferase